MHMKALTGLAAAFVGGLIFSVSFFDAGQAAEAQNSPLAVESKTADKTEASTTPTDLLNAAAEDAATQQKIQVTEKVASTQKSPAEKGASLEAILAEEKQAQADALTLGKIAKDVQQEIAQEKARLGATEAAATSSNLIREEKIVVKDAGKVTVAQPVLKVEASTAPESVTNKVKLLESRNLSMASQLQNQSSSLEELKQSRVSLQNKINMADARVRQLIAQLEDAQNRLMIAETEVERLSHALEQKHGTRLLPIRQNLAAAAAPQRTTDDPFFGQEKVSNDMSVATVVSDKANLRAGPGLNNSPIMSISRGTRLAIETRQGDWYRVVAPTGVRAWVSADVIQFGRTEHAKPSRTLRIGGYDADSEESAAFELLQRHPS
jgi:hypothetical protein